MAVESPPQPSSDGPDCAWCGMRFAEIDELLGHVEELHLEGDAAA